MKIKFIILVILLVALITIFTAISNNAKIEDFKPLELEVGDEFTGISYNNQMFVLNYGISDVTGDGENDMIIAIGEKRGLSGDTLSTNVDVIIYDTANATFIAAGLKKYDTSIPKFIFADLNGDSINDIIIIGENEDLTKSMHVITTKDGTAKEIFGKKDTRNLEITGDFIDGFKANVRLKKINYTSQIELMNKKENYVSSGFYTEEGVVNATNKKIKVTGFNDIELVAFNDCNGIKLTEKVKGFDNLDILDQVKIIIKYENNTWVVKEAVGENLGNLLY